MQDNSTIVDAVAPVLVARGLSLYDIEITGAGKARVVRVLITNHEKGGLDLDAIAAATEAISPVLDESAVAAALPGPYALEVSSPGIERGLRLPEHFRGAIGETISVKVRDAERMHGKLVAADDSGFDLELDSTTDDAPVTHVAYSDVVQARTVFEWGASSPRASTASRQKAAR
ncbi:MAG: ribosome maturation factor RimP [Acidimicrobiia bacterium]